MKKIILPMAIYILFFGLTFAQNSGGSQFDDIANLLQSDTFGFSSSDTVTIKSKTQTGVILEVPVVKKDGLTILRYEASYATTPLLKTTPTNRKKKTATFTNITGTKFEMNIDNLVAGTTYYIIIEPIDDSNNPGKATNEITIATEAGATPVAPTTAPVNTGTVEPETAFNSAGSSNNCEITNISYTQDGSSIALTRTPIDSQYSIELFSQYGNDKTKVQIGKINGSEGAFTYAVARPGTYFWTLTPMDGQGNITCKEKVQTIKVGTIPTKDIEKVTPTGPAETFTIIAMIIVAGGYYFYRKRQTH